MKITELMSGQITLFKTNSPINAQIEVVKDLFGTSIKVDNLTQSGNLIETIWKKTLKKIHKQNPDYKNCLILGLGGGSTAKLVRQTWTDIKIVGVDIDPVMVDLGKKYLKLGEQEVDIKILDAYEFIQKSKQKYDLILVDLYQGRSVPEQFSTEKFATLIKHTTYNNSTVIFNRLYSGQTRSDAVKFLKILEKVFDSVDPVYPLANVLFVCGSKPSRLPSLAW